MNFERAKAYLDSVISYEEVSKIPYGNDVFDLQKIKNFLKKNDINYEKIKYIHVAGSKGKGSTCNFIANYLWKAGYKVGMYSSPHMFELTERLWLNGKNIAKGKFASYMNHDFSGLTYFEILTVIALEYFIDNNVDYAVLEVGLGGRLDATNIVIPVLSVLTTVELEHTDILGDTIDKILNEKLGIVKKSVPILIGYQTKETERLVKNKLRGKKEVFYVSEKIHGEVEQFFVDLEKNEKFVNQAKLKNAKVAFCALELVLANVDFKIFAKVFADFKLPGRFELRKIKTKQVLFDMAHTKSSIQNLVQALTLNFPKKNFVFLMSLMKGKDVEGIMREVFVVAEKVVFTDVHEIRGISAVSLKKDAEIICNSGGKKIVIKAVLDYQIASKALFKNLKKNQLLVVTGSHFLVGKVSRLLH